MALMCGREEEEAENLIPTFKKSHFSTVSSPFAAITYTHLAVLCALADDGGNFVGQACRKSFLVQYTAKRDPPMEPWPVEDERR